MTTADAEIPGSVEQDLSDNDRLFHYTSTEGLYGILQSGTLWATHFQFLNDAQECMQARRSLERQLHGAISRKVASLIVNKRITLMPGTDLRKTAAEEAENVVDIFYQVILKHVEPFVFSAYLCSPSDARRFQHGDLQHWATYGQGAGYALQLDPRRLKPIIDAEAARYTHGGVFCSKVEYAVGDISPPTLRAQYAVLESVASKIVENMCLGIDLQELKLEVESIFIPFVRIVPFIKDSCFEHEREGRVVFYRHKVVPSGRRNNILSIAARGAFGVPYVSLFEGQLLGPDSPIERIIIGPHPECVRRKVALESYLTSKGFQIEVSESELPYSPR
jgi:hypothetical protein